MTESRQAEGFRLNQFIARSGVASRRKAEDLISAGVVTVNGKTACHPGMRIDPAQDEVRLHGKLLQPSAPITLVMHKPKGVLCTRSDPEGRATIYGLLPHRYLKMGIQSVGRLDFDSTGLLILTTDGDLHRRLEHPSSGIERVYRVKARGILDGERVRKMTHGIQLEDGLARAEKVEGLRVSGGISRFQLTLCEGRNREARRLCAALGLEVLDLKRIRFGSVTLGQLPTGEYRQPYREEENFFKSLLAR